MRPQEGSRTPAPPPRAGRAARLRGALAFLLLLACLSLSAAWRPARAAVAPRRRAAERGLLEQPPRGAEPAAAGGGAPAASRLVVVVSRYDEDVSWLADNTTASGTIGGLDIRLYQAADISVDPDSCDPAFPGLPAKVDDPGRVLPGWPAWAAAYIAEKNATKLNATMGSARDADFMARRAAGVPQKPPGRLPPADPDVRARFMAADGAPSLAGLPPAGVLANGTAPRGGDPAARRAPTALVPEVSEMLPLRILPNRASEALAIVSAIIDNWTDLPDIFIFMHAHRTAWHAPLPQDWALRRLGAVPPSAERLNALPRGGFIGANCPEKNGDFRQGSLLFPANVDANTASVNAPRWHSVLAGHFAQAWDEHLGAALGAPLPEYVRMPAAATLAVTRDAVLRHDLEWWAALRRWMLSSPLEFKWAGIVMEFAWQLVFTGSHDVEVEQEECLNVLYNM